jgi:hypothetical protein
MKGQQVLQLPDDLPRRPAAGPVVLLLLPAAGSSVLVF